jgi:carbon storage regulator
MLVITRKLDEAIVIGDGIEVRVLRVGRDGVRLGVTAPSDVTVHRLEVYNAICEANASAARDASDASLRKVVDRFRKQAGPGSSS